MISILCNDYVLQSGQPQHPPAPTPATPPPHDGSQAKMFLVGSGDISYAWKRPTEFISQHFIMADINGNYKLNISSNDSMLF